MANWQFQIEFIPRAWHVRAHGDLSPLYAEEGCDTLPAWREHQPEAPLDALFSGIFATEPVHLEDCLHWGDGKHTDAHVCHERGMVASVGMHLDARACSARVLNRIAEIAAGLDCVVLVTEAAAVVEPNVFALSHALSISRAARYVQDPHHLLDDGPDDGPEQA